jgi:hypothetical protein
MLRQLQNDSVIVVEARTVSGEVKRGALMVALAIDGATVARSQLGLRRRGRKDELGRSTSRQ